MRIIALDQSSTTTGFCVMNKKDATIVEYGKITEKGHTEDRIRAMVKKCLWVASEHDVQEVYIEGVQYQNNVRTLEILAALKGTLKICFLEKGYATYEIKSSEWRRRVGIKNRKRKEVKAEAIQMVEDLYGIQASEDESEAILFARAFSEQEKNHGSI